MKTVVTARWAIVVGMLLGALLLWRGAGGSARTESYSGTQTLADDAKSPENREDVILAMASNIGDLGDLSLTKALVAKVPVEAADTALEQTAYALLPKNQADADDAQAKAEFLKHAATVYTSVLPALKTPSAKINVLTRMVTRMQESGQTSFLVGDKQLSSSELVLQAVAAGNALPSRPPTGHTWLSGSYLIGLVTALCLSLAQLINSFVEAVAKTVGTSLAETLKRLYSHAGGSSVPVAPLMSALAAENDE